MFDMRRRDEAEGESRMMGSGRRPDFLESREARVVVEPVEVAVVVVVVGAFLRSLMKTSEYLRTCEKSCINILLSH